VGNTSRYGGLTASMRVVQVSPFVGSITVSGTHERVDGLVRGRSESDHVVRFAPTVAESFSLRALGEIEREVIGENYEERR